MHTDAEITGIIDEVIKSVWKNEIQSDYNANWIMNEDGLKNALYFHLRKRLEPILIENDLRIFTEFKDAEFQGKQYRPDMVIAHVDMESDADYWRQAVTNCVAVIELKFKSNFRDQEAIRADYDKLKEYIDILKIEGKLYMATIWECEDDQTTWIRKNAAWAKGRVTELNASLARGNCEPQFYIADHQGNNKMLVRNAEFEDMKQLGHVMAVSFRTAFSDFVTKQTLDACAKEDNCAAMLEGIYREGKMHLLIGENSGMLVWQKVQDSVEIVAIHSLPESWGTGLGHAMLEEALNQIGDQPVFLWAFKENKRARRFYEKHGFRWDGSERVSEFDGALEVRYVKEI